MYLYFSLMMPILMNKQKIHFCIIQFQYQVTREHYLIVFSEISNGIEYPDRHYEPDTDLTRVYRDILSEQDVEFIQKDGKLLFR